MFFFTFDMEINIFIIVALFIDFFLILSFENETITEINIESIQKNAAKEN